MTPTLKGPALPLPHPQCRSRKLIALAIAECLTDPRYSQAWEEEGGQGYHQSHPHPICRPMMEKSGRPPTLEKKISSCNLHARQERTITAV
mmetsp:Transcript_31911/g.66062  ORF Transcript_31911/g.66062 Transcript_31911/m.66062 type:complete len:91 (+) Transcript_31911:591-863(+)